MGHRRSSGALFPKSNVTATIAREYEARDSVVRKSLGGERVSTSTNVPRTLSRNTAKAFADYAGFVARRLSDRVRHFRTTNEIVCFTDLGHKIGQFAPGLKLGAAAVNQIRHHAVLAHGLGVQAIRAGAVSGTQ